jgi:subtilisin family serine protease
MSIAAIAQHPQNGSSGFIRDNYGRIIYAPADSSRQEYAPDEILIKLKSAIPAELLGNGQKALILSRPVDSLLAKYSVRRAEPLFREFQGTSSLFESDIKALASFKKARLGSIYKFKLPSYVNLKAAISEFRKSPDVEYAEPNYIYRTSGLSDDPYLSSEGSWGQSYKDLWGLYQISAPDAWDLATGQGVTVAVVDTGCDATHPDLAANVWINPGEAIGNGIDDDANGFIDDFQGWNFDGNNNSIVDRYGHGTHVAGTIAAIGNNNQGIIGVAYHAKVMCVKGLSDAGTGYTSNLANAIIYATNSGARVINMSWGGSDYSQVLEDALQFASSRNAVLVAAAGNSYGNASNFYPASSRYVITVGSSGHTDYKSDFSNSGVAVDFLAPGGDSQDSSSNLAFDNILSILSSTSNGIMFDAQQIVGQNYLRIRGTSMAAPHVSGVAALLLEKYTSISPEQLRQVLRRSADPLIDGEWNLIASYGRINALKALQTTEFGTARIYEPRYGTTSSDTIPIALTAQTANFREYRLEYQASDAYFWTTIASASNSAVLAKLPDWNVESIPDSTYMLRLRAINNEGAVFEDRQMVTLDRVRINAPSLNEAYSAGDLIPIYGMASGAGFKSYQVNIRDLSSGEIISSDVALKNAGTRKVTGGLLATWNTTSIQTAGFYEIQLVVKRENLSDIVKTIQVIVDPTIHPGWPQAVKPENINLGWYTYIGNVTAADLMKDGKAEILVAYNDEVRIYRDDGSSLPGWPQNVDPSKSGAFSIQVSPAAGDLDGDGYPEIAAGNIFREIYVWNRFGELLPGWPKMAAGYANTMTTLMIADVNGDGKSELIVCANSVSLSVLDVYGNTLPGWPVILPPFDFFNFPSVADLDGDGKKEIIFNTWDSNGEKIIVYGSNGLLKPGWPLNLGPESEASIAPSVADIDGDGNLEIVAKDSNKNLFLLHPDGTVLPGWPKALPDLNIKSVVLADVNADGKADVVIRGYKESDFRLKDFFYALDASGNILPGWPIQTGENLSYNTLNGPAAVLDIDGDGIRDLIGEADVNAYDMAYAITAFRTDGTKIPGFPKPTKYPGMKQSPAIMDFDGDGKLEVAWMDFRGNIFMWDLPTAASRDDHSWPMFQHDPGKTGANVVEYKSSSIERSLPSAGALSFDIRGTDAIQAGSCAAQITGPAPYGTAVFSLKQNGVTVSEAGVPATSPTTSARVFIENRDYSSSGSGEKDLSTYTGIAIANPGDTPATVTYTLRDSQGSPLATGSGTIQAHGHRARFIGQFGDADMAPDFHFPSNFTDAIQYGSLEVNSNHPVSVLGLRMTSNQRDNALMSTTPIADQTQLFSSGIQYLPRIVVGSGWNTTILLMNTSVQVERGAINFLDANGLPLRVRQNGVDPQSSLSYSIEPNGVKIIELNSSNSEARDGWVQIAPDVYGSAPAAFGILSYTQNGVLVNQTGIPTVLPTNHARVYIDLSNGHSTGLALANPSGTPLSFSATAYQTDGITSAGTTRGPFTIEANGETAAFADTFVSGLQEGFTGVLDIASSTGAFVPLSLRALTNERNEFLISLFPVADLTRAVPTTIVFPQIAAGGDTDQYNTEVILLGTGNARVILKYLSDDGSPLPVAR